MSPLSNHPATIRKLPPRAAFILTPLLLSLFMSGIVAGIATTKAIGLVPDLGWRIIQAWMSSYVIAFPSSMLLLPIVRRMVSMVVEKKAVS